jgi:hypothetical protein
MGEKSNLLPIKMFFVQTFAEKVKTFAIRLQSIPAAVSIVGDGFPVPPFLHAAKQKRKGLFPFLNYSRISQ